LPFASFSVNTTLFIPAGIRPSFRSRIFRYAVVNNCRRTLSAASPSGTLTITVSPPATGFGYATGVSTGSVTVLCGTGVRVTVGVSVGMGVAEGTGVSVGVGVNVGVSVGVGVGVRVLVGVSVGVGVLVLVNVNVGVCVEVSVGVLVGVLV
jgi:hypothetical protein